jgi:hypothetical protein
LTQEEAKKKRYGARIFIQISLTPRLKSFDYTTCLSKTSDLAIQLKVYSKPGMVVHACNPNTVETEAGESRV